MKWGTTAEEGSLLNNSFLEMMLLTRKLITLHQLRVIVCILYRGMTNSMINNYYQILDP